MSDHLEEGRSELLRCLRVLSHEEGVRRPDLVDLLKGDLRALQTVWHLNLENDRASVQAAVIWNIRALVAQLTPRQTRPGSSDIERSNSYAYVIYVSFNIYNEPDLWRMKLQDRRDWMTKEARGKFRTSFKTSQRELNHALDQMVDILTLDDYAPAQFLSKDATPSISPQLVQVVQQPHEYKTLVDRVAAKFTLEMVALRELSNRVVKKVEKERRTLLYFIIAGLAMSAILGWLTAWVDEIIPVWNNPFRIIGEFLDDYGIWFYLTLALVASFAAIGVIFKAPHRHLYISFVCIAPLVAFSIPASLILVDAHETSGYEATKVEVDRWNRINFTKFDFDENCREVPTSDAYTPPVGAHARSEAIERRIPFSDDSSEFDEKFCTHNSGALYLQAAGTNSYPGDNGRGVQGPIYSEVLVQTVLGTSWTDCGMAAVPPFYSDVSTVPNFGLEFVDNKNGSGYRPVVSLTTAKGEDVVARSSLTIPYDADGEFADSPRRGWLKMSLLREGQKYTFFINGHVVMVYEWPDAFPYMHISIQAHKRDSLRSVKMSGCRFDDFDYRIQPGS
jgi:hypothetical protein